MFIWAPNCQHLWSSRPASDTRVAGFREPQHRGPGGLGLEDLEGSSLYVYVCVGVRQCVGCCFGSLLCLDGVTQNSWEFRGAHTQGTEAIVSPVQLWVRWRQGLAC